MADTRNEAIAALMAAGWFRAVHLSVRLLPNGEKQWRFARDYDDGEQLITFCDAGGDGTTEPADVTCAACVRMMATTPEEPEVLRPPSDLDAFRTMLQHAGVEHGEAPIWGPFVGAAQSRTGTTVSLIAPRSHLVFGSTFTFDSHGNLISIDGHGK